MIFCVSVDDVCLEGFSSEEHVQSLLRFFGSEGIRATFFVIPRAEGIPLTKRSGYTALMRQALTEGHSLGQHGLEHDRFETGIPPRMILDLPHEGPARERLTKERATIEENLQVGALRKRLAEGRQILEEALETDISGFRAPCLSVCDNLFTALDAEGFRYDSSRCLQVGGWDLLSDKPLNPRPIARKDFDQVQYSGRMRTLPLTTEYTWYLKHEKFDDTMALAQHDFTSCLRAGIPFVTVAHVSPMNQCEDGCGFDFYRQILDFARMQTSEASEELQVLNLDQTCTSFFKA